MRYVLGSTAYRVVKRAKQPTLVVPMPQRAFQKD
jgi:nucleotide-binding universal stress UspA family protein